MNKLNKLIQELKNALEGSKKYRSELETAFNESFKQMPKGIPDELLKDMPSVKYIYGKIEMFDRWEVFLRDLIRKYDK